MTTCKIQGSWGLEWNKYFFSGGGGGGENIQTKIELPAKRAIEKNLGAS